MTESMKTNYILILLTVFFLCSCEKEKPELYREVKTGLYFFKGTDSRNKITQNDSLSYSFYLEDEKRQKDTVFINVRTMGLPWGTDRKVTLRQVNTGKNNAAVAGKHYLAFDDPELVKEWIIPAHSVSSNIPIVLIKTADMQTAEFRLELEIVENDCFEVALESQKDFLIKVSNIAAQPTNWGAWKTYFGEWGPVKMRFIIQYVGFSDFENFANYQKAQLMFFSMKAAQKLEEYNTNNNTILKEDDGITIVTFPK